MEIKKKKKKELNTKVSTAGPVVYKPAFVLKVQLTTDQPRRPVAEEDERGPMKMAAQTKDFLSTQNIVFPSYILAKSESTTSKEGSFELMINVDLFRLMEDTCRQSLNEDPTKETAIYPN